VSPVKRERDGSQRPKPSAAGKTPETIESWQDKMLRQVFRVTLNPDETRDLHGHSLIYLASTRDDLAEQSAPLQLNIDVIEAAIAEAASQAPGGKTFKYLLACFKRVSRTTRSTKYSNAEDPKHSILAETRRLCMSYCVFAITMPEMFGDNVQPGNPLVEHMLSDPESDSGICFDFLNEASSRFDEDESIKDAMVSAVEELSKQLATKSMLGEERVYVNGLRNFLRFPKLVVAITKSPLFLPDGVEAQKIETDTLLGPFFRLSPMQQEVANNYFSAPKTRDRGFIANAQNAVRMTLRTHQGDLFQIADTIVKAGPEPRGKLLDWFALCVNKNHKKRAMRVDYKSVSSDGFMVNITNILDQLCEPFMDYLRRNPRVDISDETKINADQKTADDFYNQKVDGTNNFISEIFFLTVAAHHYGAEAAQTRMSTFPKTAKRMEKDLQAFEADRHKYQNDPRYLARFDEHVRRIKQQIDEMWSTYHATTGVLLDDLTQARSMQFMRYVIVWLLRLASKQNVPQEQLVLPLLAEQPDAFTALPEYFLEDIVENFKFITQNIPHIITPQQCEEIMQVCITFLRNTEYVKNPGVKSGLVTILFYGIQPFHHHARGVLGDLLMGSPFAHKHLLHALMKFYIEAESTGLSSQFYDKFNIRYEIFQVIKAIWPNTLYRENLRKEAAVDTDFFVQFVNMIINDATFVLDELLSAFTKIHDLQRELANWPESDDEQRKEKVDLLEDSKGKAKSYMGLTRESMATLTLFTEALSGAFTMPEIVQRLADMLDYNLDTMVGPKSSNLKVDEPEQYGWNPRQLLADILGVFINLSGQPTFVQAIARDGRSYKPGNFDKAADIMRRVVLMSPDQLLAWQALGDRVAEAKATEEEEEEDLGEIPEEFLDPLMADLMDDPVILPTSKNTVNRSTIRSHLLSVAHDPFNRMPLKIEDVIPDTEMKAKIDAWKAERKAARAAERMDTSA
jgi:ubiquitin conjugation factor E4 B